MTSKVVVPDSLRSCPDWPAAPKSSKQSAAGKYTNGIAGVGICWQTKTGAILKIVDEHNKKMDEIEARKSN